MWVAVFSGCLAWFCLFDVLVFGVGVLWVCGFGGFADFVSPCVLVLSVCDATFVLICMFGWF